MSRHSLSRTGAFLVMLVLTGAVARAEPLPSSELRTSEARQTRTRAPVALTADLDASADYYRGYRDALRDVARANLPSGRYRNRYDYSRARTDVSTTHNSTIGERLAPRGGESDGAFARRGGDGFRSNRTTARLQTWPPIEPARGLPTGASGIPPAADQPQPQHAGSADQSQGPADRPR